MEPKKGADILNSKLCPDVKPFIPRQSVYHQPQHDDDVFPTHSQNPVGSRYCNRLCNWPVLVHENAQKPVAAASSSSPLHLPSAESSGYSQQKHVGCRAVRMTDQNKGKSFKTFGGINQNELQSSSDARRLQFVDRDWGISKAIAPPHSDISTNKEKHTVLLGEHNLVSLKNKPEIDDNCCNKKLICLANKQRTFAEVIRDCNGQQTEKNKEHCQRSNLVVDEKSSEELAKLEPLTNQYKYNEVLSTNLKDTRISNGHLTSEGKFYKNTHGSMTVVHSNSDTVISGDKCDGQQNTSFNLGHIAADHGNKWCRKARTKDCRKLKSSHTSMAGHICSSKNVCVSEEIECIGSSEMNDCKSKKIKEKMNDIRHIPKGRAEVDRISSGNIGVGSIAVETNSSREGPSNNLESCGTEDINQNKENATKQKKKKTDSQRKKEYRNKLKSLPSVQGKILTVTHEFYNLVQEKCVPLPNKVEDILTSLDLEDFPALGDSTAENACLDKNILPSDCTLDSGAHSDSDWSDIDGIQGNSENALVTEEFPALSDLAKRSKSRAVTYSALLKKSTYCGVVNQSDVCNTHKTCLSAQHTSESHGCNLNSLQSSRLVKSKSKFNAPASVSAELPKKPKAKSLIQLDLMNMLSKKQKSSKDFNVKTRYLSKNGRKIIKAKPVIANILDSSAPSRRRGKEREKPTKKKPTAMKKVILQEREEKRKIRIAECVLPNESETCSISSKELDNSLVNCHVADLSNNYSSPTTSVVSSAKTVIHNRKFREYCNQFLNPEIDEVVTKLIQDLIRFHDRLYQKDPIKAKMRRRIVVGLREVTKHLKLKKLKCLVLAPNLERIESDGGLDDAMNNIISLSQEQSVPFVFALGRRALGRICLKKVPVSCVGIFNYDGSEMNFKRLAELAVSAQEAYSKALSEAVVQVGRSSDPRSDCSAENSNDV